MTTSWLQLAEAEISRLNLNPEIMEVLRAFGGSDAPGPASLDPDAADDDESSSAADAPATANLPTLISNILSTEVDADQAQMFARRFTSVSTLLTHQNTPTSTLLRLALNRRAQQILSTDDPTKPGRALRIRALVDFLWSQSLVLNRHDDPTKEGLPTLKQMVESGIIDYHEIAPGMRHGLLQGESSDFGPTHINILRIARGAATMRCVDARTEGSTCLETLVDRCGAVSAISGGFFLYSEPDIEKPSRRTDPVGLLVTDGKVVNPPVFKRGALLQEADHSGRIRIEKVGMDGVTVRVESSTGQRLTMTIGEQGVKCFHRGQCKTVPLRNEEIAIAIVGTKVHEVMRGTEVKAVEMDVPLAGFVLTQQVIPQLMRDIRVEEGNSVEYSLTGHNNLPALQAAMAGGPILLSEEDGIIESASELPKEDFSGSAPPVTFSQDETFDRNLLPRMGAGITADGELVLAAIDGRNLDRALGLTLKGTAELLAALGCVRGLNLDGGSSKRMVIKEKGIVCLHTTEIKSKTADTKQEVNEKNQAKERPADGSVSENLDASKEEKVASNTPELSRPVHSAILFFQREDEKDDEQSRKRKADE